MEFYAATELFICLHLVLVPRFVVSFIHSSSSPTLHSDGNQMALVDYGSSSDDEEGHASQKRATPPSKKFVLYRVLTSPNAYRTDMSLGQRNCPACL